jgi:hypothetical protein
MLNLQCLATNFPFYLLFKSLLAPRSLPNSYHIKICSSNVGKNAITVRIIPNSCNVGSVMSHMVGEFKLIMQEVAPPRIIGMIAKGENLFDVMKNLLNITTRSARKNLEREGVIEADRGKQQAMGSKIEYLKQLIKLIVTF